MSYASTPSARRVLVVDDEPGIARAIRKILAPVATVETADGHASARAALESTRYDAVLTDERMPDGSGRALLAFVRQKYPRCRRVLMSGDYCPRDDDDTFEAFVPKPFSAGELRVVIARLINAVG